MGENPEIDEAACCQAVEIGFQNLRSGIASIRLHFGAA